MITENVVVLGAGGFIGSHLVDALLDDGDVQNVYAFCRYHSSNHARWLEQRRTHPKLHIIFGDITDLPSLYKCAEQAGEYCSVVNCAAMVSVPAGEVLVNLYKRTNTDALHHIATAFKRAHVVHVSTSEVFSGQQQQPYNDTDEPSPTTNYGRTKHHAERVAADYGFHVIRLFNTFGPRQTPRAVMARLCRELVRTVLASTRGVVSTVTMGDPDAVRTFVPIKNSVAAIKHLLRKPTPPKLYQFARGRALSIAELTGAVASLYVPQYMLEGIRFVWNTPELKRHGTRVPTLLGVSSTVFDDLCTPDDAWEHAVHTTLGFWEQFQTMAAFGAGDYQ